MSSWVRDIPLLPPKKVEEFVRLPKEPGHVNEVNSIEEVLPFPPPSRLFQPGQPQTGMRAVEESVRNRKTGIPEFIPISDAVKQQSLEVKPFDTPYKPKPRKILPKQPEPFVPLWAGQSQEGNKEQPVLEVKTFDIPSSVRLGAQAKVQRQTPAKYEPRTKKSTVAVAGQGAGAAPSVSQLGVSANPLITIVIPLYNGIEFLEEALQSVKRQTYNDWVGLIGVNGHGQSGEPVFSKTKEIVQLLGLSNRFSVINLPDVRGAANAINHLVGMSSTPYIAHLDADDLWLSKKLEYQMSVFEQDAAIGIVGSMCRYFGDSNEYKILPPGLLTIDDFTVNNPLIHSSILIRREYAIYSDEFVAYDYDCWVRNVKNGAVVFNINNILVLHRIHSKSFYNTSGKQDPELIKKKYGLVAQ